MLYRGECLQTHAANGGEIRPKGGLPEVTPRFDGSIKFDGRFTHGETEQNAVRAHHLESGKWGGCWVSTTRDYNRAVHFATSGNMSEGVVYALDESLFADAEVVAVEDVDPHYPEEKEVSIRASDFGAIPQSVVVACEPVKPDWME
ncbi:hypothetical protein KRX52_04205 [Pseudomonas sp. MAP12]|uniref:Uncharacterized protein n=1 Tax=Geopseudomonas aromaticivorans TaxID=2849492 RepID=A0ABS6MTY2_9GAMM|nr:hypothetical protein [Pseudomonas aromaticivorans]MBV2132000.1 hypothetical protein [Pseudomonas aromaticivorans]